MQVLSLMEMVFIANLSYVTVAKFIDFIMRIVSVAINVAIGSYY
jgi:hypothetical protein